MFYSCIVPSGAPLNVSLAVKTSSSLTFTWEQPHAELWNGIITSYSAFLTELPGSEHTINISTLTTQVMFEVLRPHTSYTFRVGAMNSVGIGPLSASVLSRTAEDGKHLLKFSYICIAGADLHFVRLQLGRDVTIIARFGFWEWETL